MKQLNAQPEGKKHLKLQLSEGNIKLLIGSLRESKQKKNAKIKQTNSVMKKQSEKLS